MKKFMLIALVAIGFIVVATPESNAGVSIGIGFGFPGFYGYPTYYPYGCYPYSYYPYGGPVVYYSSGYRPYYWWHGRRIYYRRARFYPKPAARSAERDASFQLREATCHHHRHCSPKDRDQQRPLNLGRLPKLNHGGANDDEAATLET